MSTAIFFGAVSCKKDVIGEGPVTTRTRTVENFSGIDLHMNGNVYYKKEATGKIEISAKKSIHDILETTVINGKLVIRYKDGKTYDADETIRITVSGPNVSSLVVNTSGSIFCLNNIETVSLLLRSYGSGNISLQNIITTSIDAESTVSGQITATGGITLTEKIKTNASGSIDLSAVASKTSIVHTIGSGSIKIKVSDNLNARIDGSGSVYFSGYPLITSQVSGSGRLVRF